MVQELCSSLAVISVAGTVPAGLTQQYFIIPQITMMSMFGVVRGCISQLETLHT